MVEHQSTLSENMPLRFLLYYTELIKLYIIRNGLNMFGRKAIPVPVPEFYVVYNGAGELRERKLWLKANLGGAKDWISVRVEIININYSELPAEVLERKDVLDGYSYFMDRIRYYNGRRRLTLEEAIERAMSETKEKGYLKEYLERKEFLTMVKKVLTIEEEIDLIRKEEREEGKIEGKIEGRTEVARISLKTGLSKETIVKITGLTLEEIEKLE